MLKRTSIILLGFIKSIKKKAIIVRCIILFFMGCVPTFTGCTSTSTSTSASTSGNTSKSQTTSNELSTPEKAVESKEFIWRASNRQEVKNTITVRFACDKNQQLTISFTDPNGPDFLTDPKATKHPGTIHITLANTPRSGKGYKEWSHKGHFLPNSKTLQIKGPRAVQLIKELKTWPAQMAENKKLAMEEYQQKINYCQRLPKQQQQQCYNSSSAYQDGPLAVAIFIAVEGYTPKTWGVASQFSPKELLTKLKQLPTECV